MPQRQAGDLLVGHLFLDPEIQKRDRVATSGCCSRKSRRLSQDRRRQDSTRGSTVTRIVAFNTGDLPFCQTVSQAPRAIRRFRPIRDL